MASYSKPTCKVLVVGNPANTNAYVCAKYAEGKIPTRNFSAMTRLDHNRATAQIALRSGVSSGDVKNVIIWGNHSSTQFPDVSHAFVNKSNVDSFKLQNSLDGQKISAYNAINDAGFLRGEFISVSCWQISLKYIIISSLFKNAEP